MTKFFTKCLGLLCLSLLCCFSLQNATAQCESGEVSVGIQINNTGGFFNEVEWELLDGLGNVVASDCDPAAGACTQICLMEGTTYTMNLMDSFGDGWNGNTYSVFAISGPNAGCEIASGSPPNAVGLGNGAFCGEQIEEQITFDPGSFTCTTVLVLEGCTDPDATNFSPCATSDDGSCVYPPDNDFCDSAESIECGDTKTGDTSAANAESAPFCGTSDGTGGAVWYKFLGTGADVTASLCNSSFDTKIRVYTGTCGALVCEVGNDDNSSSCASSRSEVTFISTQCTEYYILVHGFSSNAGAFELELTCVGGVVVEEDGCTDPTAHNYNEAACSDDGSCETCTDGILNGDEIDIDCGGELCDDCPCEIQSSAEIASHEGGCNNQAKARTIVVEFTGGIQPLDYEISAPAGTFITNKAVGVYQVIGNGNWSIAASDASGCINEVEGSDFVYVSNTASTPETNTTQNGTAMVEVSGGTPPYTVVWSNGVEGTIAASGGSHSITGLGRGKYEATVTDDEGGTALACVNVARVTSTGGRGGRGRGRKADISDVMNTLTVNPNPFANNTTVHFNLPESGMATMNVFALDGQQVATVFDAQVEAGENYTVELNASELSSGIYILQLTSEAGVVAHQRIVVTK